MLTKQQNLPSDIAVDFHSYVEELGQGNITPDLFSLGKGVVQKLLSHDRRQRSRDRMDKGGSERERFTPSFQCAQNIALDMHARLVSIGTEGQSHAEYIALKTVFKQVRDMVSGAGNRPCSLQASWGERPLAGAAGQVFRGTCYAGEEDVYDKIVQEQETVRAAALERQI